VPPPHPPPIATLPPTSPVTGVQSWQDQGLPILFLVGAALPTPWEVAGGRMGRGSPYRRGEGGVVGCWPGNPER